MRKLEPRLVKWLVHCQDGFKLWSQGSVSCALYNYIRQLLTMYTFSLYYLLIFWILYLTKYWPIWCRLKVMSIASKLGPKQKTLKMIRMTIIISTIHIDWAHHTTTLSSIHELSHFIPSTMWRDGFCYLHLKCKETAIATSWEHSQICFSLVLFQVFSINI